VNTLTPDELVAEINPREHDARLDDHENNDVLPPIHDQLTQHMVAYYREHPEALKLEKRCLPLLNAERSPGVLGLCRCCIDDQGLLTCCALQASNIIAVGLSTFPEIHEHFFGHGQPQAYTQENDV